MHLFTFVGAKQIRQRPSPTTFKQQLKPQFVVKARGSVENTNLNTFTERALLYYTDK